VLLILGLTALAAIRFAIAAPAGLDWAPYAITGFGTALAAGGMYSGWLGARTLLVRHDRIVLRGPFPRGTRSLELESIEMITEAPGLVGPEIHILGREGILRVSIPMRPRRAGEARTWIRRALLHRLWLHARRSAVR
jgi:hypothetical protein